MAPRYLIIVLAWAALCSGLVLPAVAPEIANTVSIAAMVLAMPLCCVEGGWSIFRQSSIALPLVGGLLLAIAFLITAKSVLHVAAIFYFGPLYLAGPLALLLARLNLRDLPGCIGIAALAGTLAALAVALYDSVVLDLSRAGGSVANPIHFADITLLLGFTALIGIFGASRWRAVFSAGPVLAVIVVILSGSRGALVAAIPMSVIAIALMTFWFLPPRRRPFVLLAGVVAVIVVAAAIFVAGLLPRFAVLWSSVANLLAGGEVDSSTMQRVVMYEAAYNTFRASPIFGHGLIDFIRTTSQYVPKGIKFPFYDHLHSDLADFAVVGGLIGLLTYSLFIAAPALGGIRAASVHRRAAILLGSMTSMGYLIMGLSNAMFGILTLTVLYGTSLALVALLARTGTARD